MIVTQRVARNVLWVMLGFALGVFFMMAAVSMMDAYRRSHAMHTRGQARSIADALQRARAARKDTSFRSGDATTFQAEINAAFGRPIDAHDDAGHPFWIVMNGERVTVLSTGWYGFVVTSDGTRGGRAAEVSDTATAELAQPL